MVLESTVICIDNGEYMRNGDFIPTRMQAQQDAANLLIQCKLRANPENCVALITMAPKVDVQVALTHDNGKLMTKLHQIQPNGCSLFGLSVRVSQLLLKHRQNRSHKVKAVVFVGSPLIETEEELIQLAKKVKKEKLNVDIVSFGEEEANTNKLKTFVETLNASANNDVIGHLVTVSCGASLQEALLQSPVLQSEDGTAPAVAIGTGGGFDFGVDPNEDPELAMALRVSLEEQRQRQEQEARRQAEQQTTATPGGGESAAPAAATTTAPAERSLADLNFDAMTEEEQMEYALQISLAQDNATTAPPAVETNAEPMEVTREQQLVGPSEDARKLGDERDEIMSDPAALEDLLKTLPGVDPESDTFKKAKEEALKEKQKKDKK